MDPEWKHNVHLTVNFDTLTDTCYRLVYNLVCSDSHDLVVDIIVGIELSYNG